MSETLKSPVTKKDIWKTLSKVNVNKHTEKVGKFTYLSWAWAIDTLMQHYPDSSWEFLEDLEHSGTKEVRVKLTIEGHIYTMWLAVMNYQNKAVPNPVATDVANARMRCLTKAIAVAGLGFYIYQGEDVPKNTKPSGEQSQSMLLQKSQTTDRKTTQPNNSPLTKKITVGENKGKSYGEIFTTLEGVSTYLDTHEKRLSSSRLKGKNKEDATLHLGNLKMVRDHYVSQGGV